MNQEDSSIEIIDVSEYAALGKAIPAGRRYRIRIDRLLYVIANATPTGGELLALAEKTPPERWQINLRLRSGEVRPIGLSEKVDLTQPGVERFVTIPLDTQAGHSTRKDFFLPESDTFFLDSMGWSWETIREGSGQWLVVRNWSIPDGYNVSNADIALMIDPGYPTSQIDMAYFYPGLSLSSGKGIGQISQQQIEGKIYQRWSRHRTGNSAWRPDLDDVSSHLTQFRRWLEAETV